MNNEQVINTTDEEIKEAIQEEQDIHQLLMDKAYADERTRANTDGNNWSYNRMLSEATDIERLAVVLGNLNYQVENGGFNQWVDNGYCTAYPDVEEALTAINTETSKKVYDMLIEVGKYLDDSVLDGSTHSQGCGGWYFDDEKCGRDTDTCYECGGSGEIENPDYDWDDEDCDEEQMHTCSECDGDGEVDSDVDYPDFNGDYRCSDLNTKFYAINTQLMEDIKVYLKMTMLNDEILNEIKEEAK
jgi:hypothetical protein